MNPELDPDISSILQHLEEHHRARMREFQRRRNAERAAADGRIGCAAVIRGVLTGGLSANELARARASGFDVEPNRVRLELQDLVNALPAHALRTLQTSTGSIGGYAVGPNDVIGAEAALQHYGDVFRAGAQLQRAPRANASIAAVSVSGTPNWLATQTSTAADGAPTMASRPLTPKNVAIHVQVSRQLLQQSAVVESMLAEELLRLVGAAMDGAVLTGTGTDMPTGVVNTSGVTAVSLATASVAKVADVRKAVETGRGKVTAAFVHPATLATLRAREVSSGGGRYLVEGSVLDHDIPVYPSVNLGTDVAVVGDFRQVTVAQWGPLQVERNPFDHFQSGREAFRVICSLDVAVVHPAAFALGTAVS